MRLRLARKVSRDPLRYPRHMQWGALLRMERYYRRARSTVPRIGRLPDCVRLVPPSLQGRDGLFIHHGLRPFSIQAPSRPVSAGIERCLFFRVADGDTHQTYRLADPDSLGRVYMDSEAIPCMVPLLLDGLPMDHPHASERIRATVADLAAEVL